MTASTHPDVQHVIDSELRLLTPAVRRSSVWRREVDGPGGCTSTRDAERRVTDGGRRGADPAVIRDRFAFLYDRHPVLPEVP